MLRVQVTSVVLFIGAVVPRLSAADADLDPVRLLAVLKSEASLFDKAKACQRLAVVGDRDAVPVLAALLDTEALAHYARFALEAIPDPAVDDALREAAAKLRGLRRIGAINSIGMRRDAKAVDVLVKFLADGDVALAGAAAGALGRIGTPEAAAALTKTLASAPEALQGVVAEATLVCAERHLVAGNRAGAIAIYDAVRATKLPSHLTLAALRGGIVARGEADLSLFSESLRAKDYPTFALAVKASREVPGEKATQVLVEAFRGSEWPQQAALIPALAERGGVPAHQALLGRAVAGPVDARIAAIRALGFFPGLELSITSALVLFKAATDSDRSVADAAMETLTRLGGKEVDSSLASLLDQPGSAEIRPVLLEVAGRRRIAAAAPAIRKAVEETDEALRLSGLRALGEIAETADLSLLATRAVAPRSPKEAPVALEALKSACRRAPDRDACASALADPLAKAPAEAKPQLLDVVGAIGGPAALKIVVGSLQDTDDRVADAAARVLGEWKGEEGAFELSAQAKAAKEGKARARTFGALNHILRRLAFPKEKRLALTQSALDGAQNDDERKAVIETLANIPTAESYALLIPLFANAALKEEACASAVRIGERAARFHREAAVDAMKKVLAASPKAETAAKARKIFEESGGMP